MVKPKVISEKGSAMVLVIIAMSLFLIVGMSIMSQINNNLKSTSKVYKETQYKYQAEANIESYISSIYTDIQMFIDETKVKYEGGTNKDSDNIISKSINCYMNGNKTIKAIIQVTKDKHGNVTQTELKEFETSAFKGLIIESIIQESGLDKYKVQIEVDFDVDENFNLSYEIKGYNKYPM